MQWHLAACSSPIRIWCAVCANPSRSTRCAKKACTAVVQKAISTILRYLHKKQKTPHPRGFRKKLNAVGIIDGVFLFEFSNVHILIQMIACSLLSGPERIQAGQIPALAPLPSREDMSV